MPETTWPEPEIPQQLHLDLTVADRASGPSRRAPWGAIARVSIVTRRAWAADPDATTSAAPASTASATARRRARDGSRRGCKRRIKTRARYHGRRAPTTGRDGG